jgi:hypothetical protein
MRKPTLAFFGALSDGAREQYRRSHYPVNDAEDEGKLARPHHSRSVSTMSRMIDPITTTTRVRNLA